MPLVAAVPEGLVGQRQGGAPWHRPAVRLPEVHLSVTVLRRWFGAARRTQESAPRVSESLVRVACCFAWLRLELRVQAEVPLERQQWHRGYASCPGLC